jgi:hypothetical protein
MTTATIDGADAAEVCEGFIAGIIPLMQAVQTDSVIHTSVRATNLFDATDAHEELISEAGELTGGAESTFNAYGFRLNGDNAAVRNGAKRVAGVWDDGTAGGVVTDGGLLGDLNTLATAFASNVLFGLLDGGTLVPVIVKRILSGGDYTLPTSLGDAVLSVVVDALVNTLITSQTSRKIGVGE